MKSFSLDISKFGKKAVANADKFCKKVVFDMHRMLVERTPVDTGRAKANNQVAINNMPLESVLEFDKTGHATIRNGQAVMQNFKLGDTVFIYNNVSYIVPLEFYGHSKQAPNGMFRITFNEIVTQLGATAREING